MRRVLAFGAVCAGAFGLVACGGSSSSSSDLSVPKVAMQQSIGAGEGQVNLVAWAGYAEDGSTDPKVNWVTPFEQQTGCKVTTKTAGTSDEMVTLMRTGQYDGVSASGNASVKLIAGGDVAPVNVELLSNYADIYPDLKNQPYNSVAGQMYGAPHGRGANLLMWRTDKVTPAPDSWGAVFDSASPYKGKITAYDDPIYIADAALYLSKTQPSLNITNPYELDPEQFAAAVALLKKQRPLIGQYWSDYTKSQAAFSQGDIVMGTTWQVIANLLKADKVPVKTVLPKEGSTGWSDTWMISSKAAHPNCMYKWMNWIQSPKPQAQVAEWFGEAPANAKACSFTADKNHCTTYSAGDLEFWKKIAFWATPTANCRDSRGNKCVDYSKWVQAWTDIKG